jgi:cytochrome c oxidase cbb3-type subunit III
VFNRKSRAFVDKRGPDILRYAAQPEFLSRKANPMKRNCAVLALALPLAFVLAVAQTQPIPANLAQGKKLYDNQCLLCHGPAGTGGRGPALNLPKLPRARTSAELNRVIQTGIPNSEMPGFWLLNEREVQQLAAYVLSLGQVEPVQLAGDAMRGQVLFEKNCAHCHIVRGQGGVAGPELTEIGARRSPAYLRAALLEPNAALPDGFLIVSITTADGRRVRGVRVNEDPFTLQLRDANQHFHSFRKAELKEVKKEFGVSTMPSYKDAFSVAELDHLVAYLYSLRGEK